MFCDRTLAPETFYLLPSLLAGDDKTSVLLVLTSPWSYNVLDTGSCYNCATNLKNSS